MSDRALVVVKGRKLGVSRVQRDITRDFGENPVVEGSAFGSRVVGFVWGYERLQRKMVVTVPVIKKPKSCNTCQITHPQPKSYRRVPVLLRGRWSERQGQTCC
jgi:hypothetical protein